MFCWNTSVHKVTWKLKKLQQFWSLDSGPYLFISLPGYKWRTCPLPAKMPRCNAGWKCRNCWKFYSLSLYIYIFTLHLKVLFIFLQQNYSLAMYLHSSGHHHVEFAFQKIYVLFIIIIYQWRAEKGWLMMYLWYLRTLLITSPTQTAGHKMLNFLPPAISSAPSPLHPPPQLSLPFPKNPMPPLPSSPPPPTLPPISFPMYVPPPPLPTPSPNSPSHSPCTHQYLCSGALWHSYTTLVLPTSQSLHDGAQHQTLARLDHCHRRPRHHVAVAQQLGQGIGTQVAATEPDGCKPYAAPSQLTNSFTLKMEVHDPLRVMWRLELTCYLVHMYVCISYQC